MELTSLLKFAVEQGASDVHIQAAAQPMLRLCVHMRAIEGVTARSADCHWADLPSRAGSERHHL